MTDKNAEAYSESECEKRLKENPETQPVCGEPYCAELMEARWFHESCEGRQIWSPVQSVGCYNRATGQWIMAEVQKIKALCHEKEQEDPNWELESCFCCCGGAADLTAVAVAADTERPISEIDKGDTVLSGRVIDGEVEWRPATVAFSQGTIGEGRADTVRLALAGGRTLTVSADQPLLHADGALSTAAELTPGRRLMGVDGAPVVVGKVDHGGSGDVHHIATGEDWGGSPDGHLIAANGVVLGDFTLQLHYPEVAPVAAGA